MGKGINSSNAKGGKGRPGFGRGVSQQRLSQKTGPSNSVGGWTKVQRSNGDFRMRPSK